MRRADRLFRLVQVLRARRFATARTAGYVAHIEEQLSGGRLIRPRGEYTGPRDRKSVPIGDR